MNTKNTNYKQKRGEWDTFYSTFYWKITLDKNHPDNFIDSMTGYSKKISESEAADKDYLLKRKILNLYTNGYLIKATRIEFWYRTGVVVDKAKDPKVLVIYPTHYDIPPANHDVIFKKFGVFLNDFYFRINNKKPMEGILPVSRNTGSKDDHMDVTKKHFGNIYTLYNYATKLIKYGHPEGEVQHFIRKYKEIKGW